MFSDRLAIADAYPLGAFVELDIWLATATERAHFGTIPPALRAAHLVSVELLSVIHVVSDGRVWLGAGVLTIFTLLAASIANAFWSMSPGQGRLMAINALFKHIDLTGGFTLLALVTEQSSRRQRV